MKKLLIVDDEITIRRSLAHLDGWTQRGIKVAGTAASGAEAIQLMEHTHMDIILSDICMPDMGGLELLEYLHRTKPSTCCIMISGFEEFDYARIALKYGAKGYVLKPIDSSELFDIIDSHFFFLQQTEFPSQEHERRKHISYHETLVNRSLEFIRNNINKPISLRDVADEVHLTPHHFGQIFKSIVGETFQKYVTQMKMEKAASLLLNPMLRVYQVSDMLGYSDPRYFSKVFQKSYGCPPNEYRMDKLGSHTPI